MTKLRLADIRELIEEWKAAGKTQNWETYDLYDSAKTPKNCVGTITCHPAHARLLAHAGALAQQVLDQASIIVSLHHKLQAIEAIAQETTTQKGH